jgi:2-haloacid dehalogenase
LSETWRAKQLEYAWLLALMGHYKDFWAITDAALRFALRQHSITLDATQYTGLLKAYYRFSTYPEIRTALQLLRHYPLAMLSNGTPRMLQAVLEHNHLQGLYTQVMSVGLLRTYKPNPLVYERHHVLCDSRKKRWSLSPLMPSMLVVRQPSASK